jgi:hypothetical protein
VALTGRGVYPMMAAADPLVAVRLHVKAAPRLDPELHAAERSVIARALESDRSRRYRTAAELAEDIEALADSR